MICEEILPEKRHRNARTVNFDRFYLMLPEAKTFINSWAQRAIDQGHCEDSESFEPFIYGWVAFNGWASCVTGTEHDQIINDSLVLDPRLSQRFDVHLESEAFRASVHDFWKLWPIIKAKEGVCIQGGLEERLNFVQEYQRSDDSIYFRPYCATRHFEQGEETPQDWAHTLQALYQVRCNLFHGSKSAHNVIDVEIVARAFRVLVHLLTLLGLDVRARQLTVNE